MTENTRRAAILLLCAAMLILVAACGQKISEPVFIQWQLGTSDYQLSLPEDYWEDEISTEDKENFLTGYYYKEGVLDIACYEYDSEGLDLETYVKKDMEWYLGKDYRPGTINGIDVAFYDYEDEDGTPMTVLSFMNGTDKVDQVIFWQTGEGALEAMTAITDTLSLCGAI